MKILQDNPIICYSCRSCSENRRRSKHLTNRRFYCKEQA